MVATPVLPNNSLYYLFVSALGVDQSTYHRMPTTHTYVWIVEVCLNGLHGSGNDFVFSNEILTLDLSYYRPTDGKEQALQFIRPSWRCGSAKAEVAMKLIHYLLEAICWTVVGLI